MVMPTGVAPVVPSIVETPAGVILETLAVYTFPAESMVIPHGPAPVVPNIVETLAGVILETLFENVFAV
jgi:hypothetical protein